MHYLLMFQLSTLTTCDKDMQTAVRLIGDATLIVGVNVSEDCCLYLAVTTCPGCTLRLAQCQLGLATAPPPPPPCDPQED